MGQASAGDSSGPPRQLSCSACHAGVLMRRAAAGQGSRRAGQTCFKHRRAGLQSSLQWPEGLQQRVIMPNVWVAKCHHSAEDAWPQPPHTLHFGGVKLAVWAQQLRVVYWVGSRLHPTVGPAVQPGQWHKAAKVACVEGEAVGRG